MQRKLAVSLLLTAILASTLVIGLNMSPVSAAPVVDGVISPNEYDGGMAVQLTGQWDTSWTVDTYIWSDTQYLYVAVNEPVPATSDKASWIEFCIDAGPARTNLDAFVLFADGTEQYVAYPKPAGGWGWTASPSTWDAATNTATEFQIKYTDYGTTPSDTIKMAIDRNESPPSYPPGESAYWPGHEEIVYPTPDLSKWGDVTMNNGAPPPPPPSGHVVDGIIGTDEYDGGMGVQLVGLTDTSWTVDAYIDWDATYLYVGVNEPVPATSGHQSWIEFCIDAGPAHTYLDAFVLFDDLVKSYVRYMKPSGGWSMQGSVSHSAASNTATEFSITYADFGIASGDTIKMSIDRNQGPAPPGPYGFAAFWPENALVYDPAGTDPSTWGDVYLTPLSVPEVTLTVSSTYDSPSPSGTTSYTPGTEITASVTSPWPFAAIGVRHVCTGWTGAGDVPASGTETTTTFTITQNSGITWNWKEQHYLTVNTDPPGIATILGEGWYDLLAPVTLTAPEVPGYEFSYWDVNGAPQGDGVNPITFQIQCVATAHYVEVSQCYLTVTAAGDGGYGLLPAPTPPSGPVEIGDNITLTASEVTYDTEGNRYVFYGIWWVNRKVYIGRTIDITITECPTEAIAWYCDPPLPPTPGDVNRDGTVDMRDIQYLIMRFMTNPSSPNWNPNADINDDGVVNMRDINIAVINFKQ